MIAALGFGALLVAASWCDVLRLRIPNLIPAALIALFALQPLLGGSVAAPLGHLQAMGLALLVLLPPFALNMLGGGDVKLLAAVALWLGTSKLAALLLLVAVGGGVFALFWLALRRLIRAGLGDRQLPRSLHPCAPVPFALPITMVAVLLFEKG